MTAYGCAKLELNRIPPARAEGVCYSDNIPAGTRLSCKMDLMQINTVGAMRVTNYIQKFTLTCLLIVLINTGVFAVAGPYFSSAGGNWTTAGTWKITSCAGAAGAVPGAADDVTICGGTVNMTASGTCHNLTISNGATLLFNTNGVNLVITGTLTVAGGATGGQITYTANTNYNGTGTTCKLEVSGNISCTSPGSINLVKNGNKYGELVLNTASNSVISGNGSISVYSMTVDKTAAASTVDITATNFVLGNNYYLILTEGTFIWDNAGTLTDCYDDETNSSLTIPQNVTMQCNAGTMNMCASGSVALNGGEIYIHGGTATAHSAQDQTDLIYATGGGIVPKLIIDGGTFSIYGGFNDGLNTLAGTVPVDFEMNGAGTLNLGVNAGSGNGSLYQALEIGDAVGGIVKISGTALITEQDFNRTFSPNLRPDFDLGGNVHTAHTVTGGTIQVGTASSRTAFFYTYMPYNTPGVTYPNFVLNGSSQNITFKPFKNVTGYMMSMTIDAGATFDVADGTIGATTNQTYITASDGTNAFYNSSSTFNAQNGILNFSGSVPQVIDGNVTTAFYDIDLQGTGAVTLKHSATAHTMTFNAIGSAVTFTHSAAGVDLNLSSNVTINQPTAAVTSSWNINAGTAEVGGNLVYAGNSATDIANVSVTSGALTVTGTANFAATNLTAASQLLNVTTGTLTFTSQYTLGTAGGTSGTLAVTSTGTINFNRAGASAFNYDNSKAPVFTTTAGCTLNFNGDILGTAGTGAAPMTLNAGSNSIFTAGSTITPGTSTLSFGNLKINAGVTVAAAGNFNVAGNWDNRGTTFTANAHTVTMNGGVTQNINPAGGGTSTTFGNLTIANTSGIGNGVIQNINTNVSGTMTLSNGVYQLNKFTLTLTSALSTAISAGSGTTYIQSEDGGTMTSLLQWDISNTNATTYTFPFGYSGSYIPFSFAVTAAGAVGTTVAVATYHTVSNAPFPPGIAAGDGMNGSTANSAGCNPSAATTILAVNRFWQINTAVGNPTANLTFGYTGAENTTSAACGGGTTAGGLAMQSWDTGNSYWGSFTGGVSNFQGNYTPGTTGVIAGTGSVSASAVTGFSTYTAWPWVMSITTNPLPVHLLSFDAVMNPKEEVDLNWTTSSEANNDYFTIERTVDGSNFEFVGKVKGAGNSSEPLNYHLTDANPHKGTSYYRLSQTDYNGKTTIFDPVPVNLKATAVFEVYPNPSHGDNLIMKLSGNNISNKEILVVLYDMEGKSTFTKVILTGQTNDLIEAIDPASRLAPGVYLIVATSDNSIYKQRIVIE